MGLFVKSDSRRGDVVYVEIEDVLAIKDTDYALCCLIDGNDVWVPRTVISEDSEVSEVNDEGILLIAEWWARDKGLVAR